MVSLPTYDDNALRPGHQRARTTRSCSRTTRTSRSSTTRSQAHYPPGSTYKLVTGTGALADHKITPTHAGPDEAVPDARLDPVLRLEPPRLRGRCTIYCGFGHSSDTFFFQLAGMLGHRPARPLGQPVRVRRSRPASTCRARSPASSRRTQWKQDDVRRADLPRRGLPGRHRPGLRRRHADPADQRLRGARQRRQALPAAARPRRRRARRQRRPAVPARSSSASSTCRRSVLKTMREAARNVVTSGTRTTSSTCRSSSPASPAPPSSGLRDSQGPPAVPLVVRRRSCPKDPYKHADDPGGLKALARRATRSSSSSRSPTTPGRRATPATEIVKYYLQLHYGIKKDYRNFDLLQRGNFYQSN